MMPSSPWRLLGFGLRRPESHRTIRLQGRTRKSKTEAARDGVGLFLAKQLAVRNAASRTGSVLPGRGDSKQFCSSVVGQGSRDLESWVEGLEGRDRTDWTWLSVFHSFGFGKVSCWRMHDAALGFAQEEPRLNFDTNVIGPTNANIIGGAGASPLQERAQSRCCHVDKWARKRSCSVWVFRAALAATGS